MKRFHAKLEPGFLPRPADSWPGALRHLESRPHLDGQSNLMARRYRDARVHSGRSAASPGPAWNSLSTPTPAAHANRLPQ